MQQSPLTEIGLPIAIAIIMVGIGLTLTVEDFRREARRPRGALVGLLAQLTLMPALGFAVAALLDLPPAIAVGIVVTAACPGGTTSNLIAYLARANVALSIVLTVLASVATIATFPLFVDLALRWQPVVGDAAVRVPVGRTVALLVGIVLLPVAVGMVVRRRAPRRAIALERLVSVIGAVVLVALVIGIAVSVRDDLGALLASAGPASILLNVGGIAIGYGVAAAAGLPAADRLTTAVELGVKNSTLGILIAVTVIGSEAVAVAPAVYGVVMYLSGGVLVGLGRRAAVRAPVTA